MEYAGVHVCTFQPGSFTGWDSEGVNQRLKYVRQVHQRPEPPTVTLTWHACKYKVARLHQRYILWCIEVQEEFEIAEEHDPVKEQSDGYSETPHQTFRDVYGTQCERGKCGSDSPVLGGTQW